MVNAALKFSDLIFKEHPKGNGVQALTQYPNGQGASVIQNDWSYGNRDNLYELAVMYQGELDYTTPITSDVLGSLTPEEVTELLQRIATLPSAMDKLTEATAKLTEARHNLVKTHEKLRLAMADFNRAAALVNDAAYEVERLREIEELTHDSKSVK